MTYSDYAKIAIAESLKGKAISPVVSNFSSIPVSSQNLPSFKKAPEKIEPYLPPLNLQATSNTRIDVTQKKPDVLSLEVKAPLIRSFKKDDHAVSPVDSTPEALSPAEIVRPVKLIEKETTVRSYKLEKPEPIVDETQGKKKKVRFAPEGQLVIIREFFKEESARNVYFINIEQCATGSI